MSTDELQFEVRPHWQRNAWVDGRAQGSGDLCLYDPLRGRILRRIADPAEISPLVEGRASSCLESA